MHVQHVLMISARRLQGELNEDPTLILLPISSFPVLYAVYRQFRMVWTRGHIQKGGLNCRRVIFSDERLFTLDGPDVLSTNWNDSKHAGSWR